MNSCFVFEIFFNDCIWCYYVFIFVLIFIEWDFFFFNKLVVIVDDFDFIEELVNYFKFFDENDEEYDKYFEWKRSGIINKLLLSFLKDREWFINDYVFNNVINFIDGFECFVCKRIYENI